MYFFVNMHAQIKFNSHLKFKKGGGRPILMNY